MKIPDPSHREQVALFRLSVIGDLLAQELPRGELLEELQARAKRRYRPPGAAMTRKFSWKTLQRWYYQARQAPTALVPASRTRGFARALTEAQRQLLLDMRAAHRSAPIELILQEAVRHGLVAEGAVSTSTLARLFRHHGLTRQSKNRATRRADVQRRRWQAARPGQIWHGDVCHLVLSDDDGTKRTELVHGLLDDASRYFIALSVRPTEQERDMLEVLCGALLQHSPPRALYLDNGSTYRGDVLALVCARLDITLIHATPHDPESRGKMERAWRTMRSRCADHLPGTSTRHDVEQALWAWLDADYHRRPHASLMGQTPRQRYLAQRPPGRPLTAGELAKALEIESRRRVKKDGTFAVDGVVYEVDGRHLHGRWVQIVIDGMTEKLLRVSYQERPVRFGRCEPVNNARRRRAPVVEEAPRTNVPFDPIARLLQQAREQGDG